MKDTPVPAPPKPKVSLTKIRVVSTVILFSILSFAAGYAFGFKGYDVEPRGLTLNISRETPKDKNVDFAMFWDIWDEVHKGYFDKNSIDDSALVYGAIKGMVSSVGDPYTVFLTPSENRVTQEDLSGNFEGVGIQIGFKGSQLAVVSPLEGSPAEDAGVKAGDIIAGIKDEEKDIERGTVGITLPEAVQIIRGPAGSIVTLSLLREGSDTPIIADVIRREINVPSVALEFVGEDESIAHLKVLKFGGETEEEWESAVLEILKKQNLSGVIVDVRNNPGGYLQGAVGLGSEFLAEGDVVVAEEYSDGSKTEFFVERVGRLTRDKVVVLVNGGSASASEILAGALRDQIEAPIVGDITFGKGTVQESKQLEGEVGLHLTVARWLTPSGYWVHDQGITPDYEVENDPETIEDEQLDQAIQVMNGFSLSSAN
jgi:carboxyl-terminal processing protease